MKPEIHRTLDTSGLVCPEPVMMLHKAIKDVMVEQRIEVIATDPSTLRDIPKFCLFLGHELIEQSEQEDVYRFIIQKTK
jgi:tRNA 2-thiouridine synthesizing protein A